MAKKDQSLEIFRSVLNGDQYADVSENFQISVSYAAKLVSQFQRILVWHLMNKTDWNDIRKAFPKTNTAANLTGMRLQKDFWSKMLERYEEQNPLIKDK